MSNKFIMIPKIYAGDLPREVEEELQSWDQELCFHGDGGCVFHIRNYDLNEVSLFIKWMIEIGAWTETQVNDISNVGKYLTVAMTGT